MLPREIPTERGIVIAKLLMIAREIVIGRLVIVIAIQMSSARAIGMQMTLVREIEARMKPMKTVHATGTGIETKRMKIVRVIEIMLKTARIIAMVVTACGTMFAMLATPPAIRFVELGILPAMRATRLAALPRMQGTPPATSEVPARAGLRHRILT